MNFFKMEKPKNLDKNNSKEKIPIDKTQSEIQYQESSADYGPAMTPEQINKAKENLSKVIEKDLASELSMLL